ncbi:MAG: hypothetical protein DRJ51_04580 [Thermoprotei archaeon]|nr:MAG: hypothetical protein DRJ51_04580 [Thermoprotei archaeon]
MPSRLDPALCAKCKGVKRLCGRPRCPILKRIEESLKVTSKISRRVLFGASPPSVLVGEYAYPRVTLGPLACPISGVEAKEYEDYKSWWGRKTIDDIIRIRASMVYSRFNLRVSEARSIRNRLLETTQELALSTLPVDAEFFFKKPPKPILSFDGILSPIGPRASLLELKVVQNPVVPRKVDRIVDDTDVKATDAVAELYSSGISYYHITRLFSLGLLGEKRRRRLVPTRWSITAVDSILGDRLLEKVKDFPEVSEILLFRAEYIGNKYSLIFLPRAWSFEMVEIWLPRSVWVRATKPYITVNYELKDGRWRRPGVDGGYHAIRFPVLEYLYRVKRQATVIAIREVSPEYYAPVGSWQIRESVRNALKSPPTKPESLSSALKEVSRSLQTDIKVVISESFLLKALLHTASILKYLDRERLFKGESSVQK